MLQYNHLFFERKEEQWPIWSLLLNCFRIRNSLNTDHDANARKITYFWHSSVIVEINYMNMILSFTSHNKSSADDSLYILCSVHGRTKYVNEIEFGWYSQPNTHCQFLFHFVLCFFFLVGLFQTLYHRWCVVSSIFQTVYSLFPIVLFLSIDVFTVFSLLFKNTPYWADNCVYFFLLFCESQLVIYWFVFTVALGARARLFKFIYVAVR